MVEKLKSFFLKFISGRLGLAVTFWLYGVLVAVTLDFLTSHAQALWQVVVLAVITFVHFILIIPAVWNASQIYQGKPIWKWLARVVALLNVAKWLWYLPILAATISAALGLTILSSEYWELNWRDYVCQPAEYLKTPEMLEMLEKKYHCASTVSTNGEIVAVRCQSDGIINDHIFAKSEQDCQKYLTKLKSLHK